MRTAAYPPAPLWAAEGFALQMNSSHGRVRRFGFSATQIATAPQKARAGGLWRA